MKRLLTTTVLAAGLAAAAPPTTAHAQGASPFLSQMMMVGFTFCPRGWADAHGQIESINAQQSLYSLLGTTYGGDGRTTFGYPDLRGRMPIGYGQGAGLPDYTWGEKSGTERITLNSATIGAHTHVASVQVTTGPANVSSPNDAALASSKAYVSGATPSVSLDSGTLALANTGGSNSYNNLMPFLTIRHCMATTGIFPPRN